MAKRGRQATAIAIMAAIIATLFVLCSPRPTSRSSVVDPTIPVRPSPRAAATPLVRVLGLDFAPVLRSTTPTL